MSDDGDITTVAMGAVAMHELFTSLVDAGFDAGQALYLVGVSLAARRPGGRRAGGPEVTAPAPVVDTDDVVDTGPDETLIHWFCQCEPDLAYCGWDVSGHEVIEGVVPDGDMCVVCADYPMCPRCLGSRS